VLYDRPGGKKKVRIPARTDWGTARVLGVVRRTGNWLAVQAPELGNGEIGWIHASRATLGTVAYSLHVDLSRRRIEVRRDGKAVRRLRVAVGRPDHPTPKGRFSVTDKLKVTNPASVYGCCVLALSGHQTRLPEGWPGGDRLAIHATRNPTAIGHAVSLGCMRAATGDARWLIDKLPLGTPVFVKG
jgi:lipoprotein-anchoring transpeptidase ErfK/SrfK